MSSKHRPTVPQRQTSLQPRRVLGMTSERQDGLSMQTALANSARRCEFPPVPSATLTQDRFNFAECCQREPFEILRTFPKTCRIRKLWGGPSNTTDGCCCLHKGPLPLVNAAHRSAQIARTHRSADKRTTFAVRQREHRARIYVAVSVTKDALILPARGALEASPCGDAGGSDDNVTEVPVT